MRATHPAHLTFIDFNVLKMLLILTETVQSCGNGGRGTKCHYFTHAFFGGTALLRAKSPPCRLVCIGRFGRISTSNFWVDLSHIPEAHHLPFPGYLTTMIRLHGKATKDRKWEGIWTDAVLNSFVTLTRFSSKASVENFVRAFHGKLPQVTQTLTSVRLVSNPRRRSNQILPNTKPERQTCSNTNL
jgi:hypothetical protein